MPHKQFQLSGNACILSNCIAIAMYSGRCHLPLCECNNFTLVEPILLSKTPKLRGRSNKHNLKCGEIIVIHHTINFDITANLAESRSYDVIL